jgi:glyoxylase-like metal-dependent hydrolase (beta-lactamase superfamily II)
MGRQIVLASILAVGGLVAFAGAHQQDFSKVQIKTEKIADNLYVLFGDGGNIGLSVGPDGAFLIDDQYAPLTDKILAAVKAVSPQPVRYVVNTHWHGDHSGGNENLGKAGALIVAHDNVRRRMSTEQFIAAFNSKVPPSPKQALPVITFPDEITLHLNGDEVHAVHVPPAHTDGDAIVHFRKGNVIHMGDLYFTGMYPFIDLSSGGSVDGMIGAAERALKMADARTRIIPGHGPMGDQADLRAYHNMLVTVHDRIRPMVKAGRSLAEVRAAAPTKDLDDKWGKGFLNPAQFIEIVFRSYGGKG